MTVPPDDAVGAGETGRCGGSLSGQAAVIKCTFSGGFNR